MSGQLSVGEDLFATLIVVGLIAIFVAALAHAYHVYAERRAFHEDFGLALGITNRLKNDVLARHGNNVYPGLINPEAFKTELPEYRRLLASQGIQMHVEVRSLDGKLILASGPSRDLIGEYLSPSCSVSLPIAFGRTSSESRQLGELTVRIWRG
jgi:hypothetical protein